MFSFREVADLIFLSNFEIPKLGKEALLMKTRVAGLTTARVVNLFRACLSHAAAAAACMSADFFNEKDLQLLQPNTSTSEKRLNSEICGQYLSAGRYYNRCYCCKIQFFTGSMKVQNYQMILDK